ncbi:MAG: hypothetical protein QW273_03720 [Candidatus Pacearchaeota archaeon]
MNKLLKLPQEVEVWYIIPQIRKEIAKIFVNEKKFSYEKTAELLFITKSAVVHYLKNKRANNIKFPKNIQEEIRNSAERISKGKSNFLIEIMRLLKIIKKTKCSCEVCKKYNFDIIKYCNCEAKY